MPQSNGPILSRRRFLIRSGLIGCSVAASPLLTPISFAAAPGDNRLVVIILRGAMDGLDVVQPYGDSAMAAMRPTLLTGEAAGSSDLDGFFALHPALVGLMPLWQAGELGFAHAVSTPYRDKRSHFDGQDLLEAGTPGLGQGRDGWLNRMLQQMPGVTGQTAYALGHEDLLLLRGAAAVSNWTPDAGLRISPQAERLAGLVMHDDPLFNTALEEALLLSAEEDAAQMMAPSGTMAEMAPGMMTPAMDGARATASGHLRLAEFAARQLRGASRIAAFSLGGWDTHQAQAAGLTRALGRLSETILALREGLGPEWERTAVLALTEFGRTARENGTKGTDHGTAGAMLMAGGAVRGGQVITDWPGLGTADLYQGRDLMPTRDVRAHAAWAMRGLFGLETAVLEQAVFPGLEMGPDPRLLR
ncbi:MAG: DUF1501 domain-containing protein [Rhodobacterales bacterium]|nr:DUF1501 domain-containing protein [Rhodobacterales bacterium]MDX5411477.1 DUF1501 domain-containing protein [Rhodobacterales bacterium]